MTFWNLVSELELDPGDFWACESWNQTSALRRCIKKKKKMCILSGWPVRLGVVKDKETHEEIVTAHRKPSETVTGEERQKIVTFRLGSIFGRVPFPHSAKY